MVPELFFFLFYLKVSETYIVHQNIFRAFHCTSLALLSLKNTIHYGATSLLDVENPIQKIYSNSSYIHNYNDNDGYYLKIIMLYFFAYILYDLKHSYKRYDLFIHHIVCLLWVFFNYKHFIGFISVIIMAEGVTFAYFIHAFKYQLVYRLLFTFIVRFPIWVTVYKSYLFKFNDLSLLDLFTACMLVFMFGMDSMWSINNFKKLKRLPSLPSLPPTTTCYARRFSIRQHTCVE